MEFDEEKAIEFIRNYIGEEISSKYSDDDIIDLIDIVFDYYDSNGLLDIDLSDDDEVINMDDIVNYAKKIIKKDKENRLDIADIEILVEAELKFEEMTDNLI